MYQILDSHNCISKRIRRSQRYITVEVVWTYSVNDACIMKVLSEKETRWSFIDNNHCNLHMSGFTKTVSKYLTLLECFSFSANSMIQNFKGMSVFFVPPIFYLSFSVLNFVFPGVILRP